MGSHLLIIFYQEKFQTRLDLDQFALSRSYRRTIPPWDLV